ncbi:hypothetical protein [Endozoicomonas sp. 8E]|uniref:hypothetical protein n=1 Tax=Endozoicomonas sp. 8E TaxID=3035692 RepID=UPI002938DDFD|nr:hypothetical protein [Endozoicomonas sp. 8E]WOG26617.1 hypothetical protein P6910_19005 [Endozoicomonas sp. 8E]
MGAILCQPPRKITSRGGRKTSGSHAFKPCGSQRGNELTPVIPSFILVIPAKAGIHTDSPPEPYCPLPPPRPCHP